MSSKLSLLILITCFIYSEHLNANSLWPHFQELELDGSKDRLGLQAKWNKQSSSLELSVSEHGLTEKSKQGLRPNQASWYGLSVNSKELKLERVESLSCLIKNTGEHPTEVMFWIVGSNGWGASGETHLLKPGDNKIFSAKLRVNYPDGTPKLNPNKIEKIQWMIQKPKAGQKITISSIETKGIAEAWKTPDAMIDLPPLEKLSPQAGKRVRHSLPEDQNNHKYFVLYLPEDWKPNKNYPVIFEFPGNLFYTTKACYSTGRPESCVMGYGITQGKGSIWVSLPFIDEARQDIAMSGFGSNAGEDTLHYALKVIDYITKNWGGDKSNLFLSGFSRGSIACGYIGLRNDTIAQHWKGIIGCQHYDGSNWQQSNLKDAIQRAPRFQGKAIFQVDNSIEQYGAVMEASNKNVDWTWIKSGLGYHSTTMFLDNRPMMIELRNWYQNLIKL